MLLPEADFAAQYLARPDLIDHLTVASKSGNQIAGGHNMVAFEDYISQ